MKLDFHKKETKYAMYLKNRYNYVNNVKNW